MKHLGYHIVIVAVAALCAATASSCQDKKGPEVPLSDEQLLYNQALRELPDQDLLEQQVEQYRQELYIQTYLNLMLQSKAEAVTDEDCSAYYEAYGSDLKLDGPIVKGLLIKLPKQSKPNKELQGWLMQLSQGDDECMMELEQFCAQRAAVYDNFNNQWVRLNRLTDQLPITIVEPRHFLSIKAYSISDQDYDWQFVVTDYRLAGEKQPYDWARQGILELLIQQKRETFRQELITQLKNI